MAIDARIRELGSRHQNLDRAIQALSAKVGQGDREVVSLTGTYNNLLRMWAEV